MGEGKCRSWERRVLRWIGLLCRSNWRRLQPPAHRDGRSQAQGGAQFKWINTVLGNLKTSQPDCNHAFDLQKYAARYLGAFCYRFNRRLDLRKLHQCLLVAAASAMPWPLRSIRVADVHCQLSMNTE